jgi:acylphosphatase
MKHVNIIVLGFIQGVGFRNAANRQAKNIGINGFIENKPDGSVYIEAEGNANAIQEFIEWCHRGPVYARVDELIVKEGKMKYFKSFYIHY